MKTQTFTASENSRWPRWLTSEHPMPWLFPASATLIAFGLYPILYALWLSFNRRNPITRENSWEPGWNWGKLLSDDRVWDAISTTYIYTGVALVIPLVLGLGIALLLDTDRRGFGLMRRLSPCRLSCRQPLLA
jgi:multiple sugar transport system permease protein